MGAPGTSRGGHTPATRMATDDPGIICPTCGEREWELAGEDVARCANCGYLWILPAAPGRGGTGEE
jgi:DNA-directed RNA polymerase subunit RPC12/RpoP